MTTLVSEQFNFRQLLLQPKWNIGKFEFKHPTSVLGDSETVPKTEAGTLEPTTSSVLFAEKSLLQRLLKQTLLKHNRSRRLIFDWEVRHHDFKYRKVQLSVPSCNLPYDDATYRKKASVT